ncbi:MAG: hypothetical protein HQL64_15210 [Magnetococcales bacterium]|nr:hypothetical protein [Magnetococcales bacterium]
MALTVQTNLAAINSRRYLDKATVTVQRTLLHLASGKRITEGRDDPSGLAVVSHQSAQIRGLQRATLNANDGISMVQVASGAMEESVGVLQRLRELAVYSANSVPTQQDRQKMQLEVTQLLAELDRIATDTQFNGMVLLDGRYAGQDTVPAIPPQAAQAAQPAIPGVKGELRYVGFDAQGNMLGNYNPTGSVLNSFEVVGNRYVERAAGDFPQDLADAFSNDGPLNGLYEIVVPGQDPVPARQATEATAGVPGIAEVPGFNVQVGDDEGETVGVRIPDVRSSALIAMSSAMQAYSVNRHPDIPWAPDPLLNLPFSTYLDPTRAPNDPGGTGVPGTPAQYQLIAATPANYPGKPLPPVDVNGNPSLGYEDWFFNPSTGAYVFTQGVGNYRKIADEIPGVEGTPVNREIPGQQSSVWAITMLDQALEKVNLAQAQLGGVLNRLESSAQNLGVMTENMSRSRSQNSDADIAQETMLLTRNTIIQQAATAILAQANQQPQLVMELLAVGRK